MAWVSLKARDSQICKTLPNGFIKANIYFYLTCIGNFICNALNAIQRYTGVVTCFFFPVIQFFIKLVITIHLMLNYFTEFAKTLCALGNSITKKLDHLFQCQVNNLFPKKKQFSASTILASAPL